MLKTRLIACLVLRDGLVVQSIGFRRYLPVGSAKIAVEFVAKWDVDEIVLLDISATRQGRGPDLDLIGLMSEQCFVPLTIGGGVRSVRDIREVIRASADKVSINTAGLEDPAFISRAADTYGSQCVVVSIDAKQRSDGGYEVFSASGRNPTGRDPGDWAREAAELGAGEILINSIDRDGSRLGYDLKLIRKVSAAVDIPVIACGGVGAYGHLAEGIIDGNASAVAAANIFHHVEHSTILGKAHMQRAGVDVRLDSLARYESIEFDGRGRLLKKPEEELDGIWFESLRRERI